jgi:hypothetical protein
MGTQEVHSEIVATSLHHGQDFEITQVRKVSKDNITYIIAASPE